SDNGPFERQGDCNNTGVVASLAYQPKAMRFRGISVLTNTPPRGPQSQPGGTQSHIVMEPVIAKAARKLGIDQVAIRRLNSPEGKAPFGPPAGPKAVRQYATSAFIKEALDKGAQMFRRVGRVRRPVRDQARRHALRPVWHRQSRNRVGQRLPPSVGRVARRAVGQG